MAWDRNSPVANAGSDVRITFIRDAHAARSEAFGLAVRVWRDWPVVQLVARLTLDQKVLGSSPSGPGFFPFLAIRSDRGRCMNANLSGRKVALKEREIRKIDRVILIQIRTEAVGRDAHRRWTGVAVNNYRQVT